MKGRVRVKEGWLYAGKEGDLLGENVFCEQSWTPVKWDNEEDPEFCKTAALEIVVAQNSTLNNTESDAICPYWKKGFTCAINICTLCGKSPCTVMRDDKRAHIKRS